MSELGEVILVSTENDTLVMSNPKLETMEGKKLIVGILSKEISKNNHTKDRKCAISLDHITDYMVFDSVEEYNERIALS